MISGGDNPAGRPQNVPGPAEQGPAVRQAEPPVAGSWADDTRVWAPPREGVTTEKIGSWEVVTHGVRAGFLVGILLGIVEMLANAALGEDSLFPFRFAAGIVVGPDAFSPEFSSGAAIVLGTVMHLLISVGVGVTFMAALRTTFQLSARPALMLLYGLLFGVTVWEVNFLAVLPIVAPELVGQLDLDTQLVNGLATYSLVFGPMLAAYALVVRPGVHDRWWEHDPDRPTEVSPATEDQR